VTHIVLLQKCQSLVTTTITTQKKNLTRQTQNPTLTMSEYLSLVKLHESANHLLILARIQRVMIRTREHLGKEERVIHLLRYP